LLEFIHTDSHIRFKGDAYHCLVLATRPKVNAVNGIVWGNSTDVTQGYGHISIARSFLNGAKYIKGQPLRRFHASPSRRAETQEQLASRDSWENLTAKIRTQQNKHQNRGDKECGNGEPAPRSEPSKRTPQLPPHPRRERTAVLLRWVLVQCPSRKDGHE